MASAGKGKFRRRRSRTGGFEMKRTVICAAAAALLAGCVEESSAPLPRTFYCYYSLEGEEVARAYGNHIGALEPGTIGREYFEQCLTVRDTTRGGWRSNIVGEYCFDVRVDPLVLAACREEQSE